MPISITDLQRGSRTFTVTYEGDEVKVTYNPGHYTPELEELFVEERHLGRSAIRLLVGGTRQVPDGQTKEGKPKFREYHIPGVLLSWDVLDTEGKPIAPTEEFLARLPSRFLWAVVNGLREDMLPKERPDETSGGTS